MVSDVNALLSDEEKITQLVKVLSPRIAQEMMSIVTVWGDASRIHKAETAHIVNCVCNTVSGHIWIGDHVFCGHNVSLLTGTHRIDVFDQDRQEAYPTEGRDIRISQGVWIASNATILGPCHIGRDAAIGAGAVVMGDVRAGWFYAGVPARPIKPVAEKYAMAPASWTERIKNACAAFVRAYRQA